MTRKQVLNVLNTTCNNTTRRRQNNHVNGDNSNSIDDDDDDDVPKDEMRNNNINIDDEEQQWNFISQEEHPITGRPSYFFHPCQTACRMQLIYPDKEILNRNPGKWILTWLSMILPSAGFRIQPQCIEQFDNINV